MKKRLFGTILCLLGIGCFCLSGCHKAAKTNAAKKNSGVVTIVYSRGKDTTDATNEIVAEFNKKYEGKIHVNMLMLPNSTDTQHDQYVTVFNAAGSDYDVFLGDVVWPAEFAEAGYALPLDTYIERDGVDLNAYLQGPIDAVTFKGKMWGMPMYVDSGFLFYRNDIVSDPPKTWEQLDAFCEKLKGKADFSYVCQAKQYEGLICNAVEFISAYGGNIVDGNGNITIKSEGTKKGLEMMKKIITSDYVPNNITNFSETETESAFINGKSIFARNWPYLWVSSEDSDRSSIVGKVAIAPLPAGSVRSASTLGGWIAMINKYTKHPEESWTFLKFLTGKEGQTISAVKGGLAPTLISLYSDEAIKKASPLFADPNFLAGLKKTVPRPVSPIYKKLSNIMQVEISNYLSGKQSVDAAIDAMDTKMKEAVIGAGK